MGERLVCKNPVLVGLKNLVLETCRDILGVNSGLSREKAEGVAGLSDPEKPLQLKLIRLELYNNPAGAIQVIS